MRRLTITFELSFGHDEPEPEPEEEHDSDLTGGAAERIATNEPDERAQLDSRRPIGFSTWEDS